MISAWGSTVIPHADKFRLKHTNDPYLGPCIRVLFKGGEDLLSHLLLISRAGVERAYHRVQQADVQLLVEVQQFVYRFLGQQRHLEGGSPGCKILLKFRSEKMN